MNRFRLAIFASGNGSNALNIIKYFDANKDIEVALIVSNKETAPIVQIARDIDFEVVVLSNEEANNGTTLSAICKIHRIDFVILAGYLRMIPADFIHSYEDRIINIHPALLPKYGGKGMYGMNVHRAVVNGGELESGITVHLVNERFDEGRILAQFKCKVEPRDTPEILQHKVHLLEMINFPKTIEDYIRSYA